MPKVVTRTRRVISFLGRVNDYAHRQFMSCLHDFRERGHRDLVLDFSLSEAAFPSAMIPLLAWVDGLRREDIGVTIRLPRDARLKRLFLNANWAHFLEPGRFPESEIAHERHLAAQRFVDSEQQQNLVNACMDVVIHTNVLARDVIAGLEWSINEITDNVLNHAQCAEGGIAQVSTFQEKVAFAVADSGQGILSSLREGHPELRTDEDAIGEAMKAGITRNPDAGQGNGLAGALRIVEMSHGRFEITSGVAHMETGTSPADGSPFSQSYRRSAHQSFPGTFVYVEVGLHAEFRLAEALGFGGKLHQPTDLIELSYETEAGDALVLEMRDQSTGFGSRLAGRRLRNLCENLLNAEPSKPLILDWSGVPLVSSSFADEFAGKLFAALGPLTFSARVRNQRMEAMVRGLVDKAIMQRVAQVTNGVSEHRRRPFPPGSRAAYGPEDG